MKGYKKMNIQLDNNYYMTDACFNQNYNEIVLDYINNFLTISKLVEHYRLTDKQALKIINR